MPWIKNAKLYMNRFDRVVWLLVGAVFVESMGRFLVDPYLTLFLHDKGISYGAVGMILAMAPLAGVVMGLIGGSLSDRWGRRPVQIMGVSISGLALLGFGFAGNHPALLGLLNFANGMSRALYRPATQAAITDVTPSHLRSEAFGLRRSVLNIGAAIGPVAGLALYHWLPSLGFWLAGSLNLVVGLYLALVVPETKPKATPAAASAQVAAAAVTATPKATAQREQGVWGYILRDYVLWVWTISNILTWGVYRLIDTFLPLHLQNQQVPGWVYGTLLPINAAICVLVQLPLNHWLAEARIGLVNLVSALPYAVAFLGFGFARLPVLIIASMVAFTAAECLQAAAGPRFVPELAPKHLRGRYMGISGLQDLGRVLCPILGGWAMEHWGGYTLFALAAAVALAGGLLALVADNMRLSRLRRHTIAGRS